MLTDEQRKLCEQLGLTEEQFEAAQQPAAAPDAGFAGLDPGVAKVARQLGMTADQVRGAVLGAEARAGAERANQANATGVRLDEADMLVANAVARGALPPSLATDYALVIRKDPETGRTLMAAYMRQGGPGRLFHHDGG